MFPHTAGSEKTAETFLLPDHQHPANKLPWLVYLNLFLHVEPKHVILPTATRLTECDGGSL